ncbi:MAG TPA: hypothetical protein VKB88_25830 [Bryobacteraceae bacterium]|nr:hypothetical protein [Bryobacteraceae bacterium]
MTKKLLFVTTVLLVVALGLWAADATGKWTFEQQGRNGPQTVTLDLKADGSTLTGTVSGGTGGRQGGGAPQPAPVSDGKIDGNTITFKVVREYNGNQLVTSYKGTLEGDSLKLDVTRPGRNGGEPQTNTVTAKRATT